MKATQGNMPLDRKYTLVKTEYNGKYSESDLTAICWQCENCGKGISNIATVKDDNGKTWLIGLDCAATMTGIEPSQIAEAKKQMAKEAKFRKWMMEKMTYYVMESGIAHCFSDDIKPGDNTHRWSISRYDWRCKGDKYAAVLAKKPQYKFTENGKCHPYGDDYAVPQYLCELA